MTTALTVPQFAENQQTLELAKYHSGDSQEFNLWLKSAMIAIVNTPTLQECLKTPSGQASLYQSMRMAASTKLSLNPQEGKAAIIAYKEKAQYQIMKNGYLEMAHRSGKVKFITCDTVRENDVFDIEKTSDGDKYSFKPKRTDRGEIDGFFASIVMKDGTCNVKYMTVKEAEEFRNKYSSLYKNKPDASPWKKSFEGMATKTVIKALLRNVSISPELSKAIGSEDEQENKPMLDVTPPSREKMAIEHLTKDKEPEIVTPDDDEPFLTTPK